ncbi:hypothetical protein ISF9_052 [Microbacterium phage vB_MoxS-ISF9]|uniref:Uncharacterized protein n=1 Tax=Microbacterium phage vB_MoxS-ISF9 TaxID=1458670 RepID=W8P098_9CAUD|nr:hypothetical protein ISF9_052 [Microbacterium phage vB_MoxS-ISF9]AHL18522.1 hypothetical protein ISF9_052 [Microbacterium phage vB_MoxS-ISF9]
MSSDLKDARWQLGFSMAEEDGVDWFEAGFHVRAGYLSAAQTRLDANPERIPALAEKWREHP